MWLAKDLSVFVFHFKEPAFGSLIFPIVFFCRQAPLAFKAKCSGGSLSCCQNPQPWSLTGDMELPLLCESLCDTVIFQFVSHPHSGYWIISGRRPSYLVVEASFFIFGCQVSLLEGSSPFLSRVVQQLVVILVFSCEEVCPPPSLPSCLLSTISAALRVMSHVSEMQYSSQRVSYEATSSDWRM